MSERPRAPEPTHDGPQSIAELVFGGEAPAAGRRRFVVAGLSVLALYLSPPIRVHFLR
jgi:hypothetical protein